MLDSRLQKLAALNSNKTSQKETAVNSKDLLAKFWKNNVPMLDVGQNVGESPTKAQKVEMKNTDQQETDSLLNNRSPDNLIKLDPVK